MAATSSPGSSDGKRARVYLERGIQYMSSGDLQAAGNSLLQAVRLDDTLALAHYHLGNCLRRYGDNPRAEQALLAAIERDALLKDAYTSLAYLYYGTGRVQKIAPLLGKLLAAQPDDIDLRFQLGGLLVKFGQLPEAERMFAAAPARDSHQASACLTLGNAYQAAGEFARAEQSFMRAIELDVNSDAAYLRVANTRRFGPQDAELTHTFESLLARTDLSNSTRVCLHFSLGKICDDLKEYDRAFAHFRDGNALQHGNVHFDRPALAEYIARCKRTFTPELLRCAAATGDGAPPQPIFVIGMLRSGTTLVERILASHAQCYGLGETELVDALTRDIEAQTHGNYPECLLKLTPALSVKHAAALHLGWPPQSQNYRHVVDKNPLNFLHLGLIALLYPHAPILHCVRDAMDTCLSIYFQHFAHSRNTYAYDLDDIGYFYCRYRELMDFWQSAFPERIYRVPYEDLVREPEPHIRRLVAAAGLDWDPACLVSHTQAGRIQTASVWQARQPIYSSSIGRSRNYAKHLGALRTALTRYT